ncbi:hypothetical protein KKH43_02490 [Patescibacteria group bacterium]|nr:hypothetical protein [Patescibacteria group bacterium]
MKMLLFLQKRNKVLNILTRLFTSLLFLLGLSIIIAPGSVQGKWLLGDIYIQVKDGFYTVLPATFIVFYTSLLVGIIIVLIYKYEKK